MPYARSRYSRYRVCIPASQEENYEKDPESTTKDQLLEIEISTKQDDKDEGYLELIGGIFFGLSGCFLVAWTPVGLKDGADHAAANDFKIASLVFLVFGLIIMAIQIY